MNDRKIVDTNVSEFAHVLRDEWRAIERAESKASNTELFGKATTDDVEAFVASVQAVEYLVPGFIPYGQLTHIFAPSGSGKTLLLMHWLLANPECRAKQVLYLNLDDNMTGLAAKSKVIQAAGSGINMYYDFDPKAIMPGLLDRAKRSELADTVIVFDTLKKFVDSIIDKHGMARFLKTLRTLTIGGATIITLGHSNKYFDDATGEPVFEGVGDIKNDVDNLFAMWALGDKADEQQYVQIKCEKDRGKVKQLAVWTYCKPVRDEDAYTEMLDSVRWLTNEEIEKRLIIGPEADKMARYAEVIIFIKAELAGGELMQKDLLAALRRQTDEWSFGKDKLKQALKDLDHILVSARRIRTNNTLYWSLKSND